jgi:fatty acid amide hydrolase
MPDPLGVSGAVTDLCDLAATEIASGIRAGYFSSREVVNAHIRRTEAINPRLNAVVYPLFEQAAIAADAADAARARGGPLGPLHGVPMTIKDQFRLAGTPATWGLPSEAHHLDTAEGPLVQRLRAAGAIFLGKTNVPQLMAYHESDNPLYGRTSNPWDLERTPGGSSGGEASIISARGSALGLGADVGGSLRIPAHFCGLYTLKPTSGRLTNCDSPEALFPWGQEALLVQPGPLARCVADIVCAMSVLTTPIQGQQIGSDPAVPPVPWDRAMSDDVRGLRIAMYTDDGFFSASPSIRRGVREAADALCERGAIVEDWTPPDVLYAMEIFARMLSADRGGYVRRTLGRNPRDYHLRGFLRTVAVANGLRPGLAQVLRAVGQANLAYLLLNLRGSSADGYMRLIAEQTHYRRRFLSALDQARFDAILCPSHALPALRHHTSYYLNLTGSYSLLFNLLGMPAGVVPATRVRAEEESDRARSTDMVVRVARKVEAGSAGLPVGVQIVARHWREDVILTVMSALESHFRNRPEYPAKPPL